MFNKNIKHQQPALKGAVSPFLQTEPYRTKPHTQDPHSLLAFTSQEILSANRRKEYYARRGGSTTDTPKWKPPRSR